MSFSMFTTARFPTVHGSGNRGPLPAALTTPPRERIYDNAGYIPGSMTIEGWGDFRECFGVYLLWYIIGVVGTLSVSLHFSFTPVETLPYMAIILVVTIALALHERHLKWRHELDAARDDSEETCSKAQHAYRKHWICDASNAVAYQYDVLQKNILSVGQEVLAVPLDDHISLTQVRSSTKRGKEIRRFLSGAVAFYKKEVALLGRSDYSSSVIVDEYIKYTEEEVVELRRMSRIT